jgi:hypothetical protein
VKAKKVLKRVAKIEALISDLTDRCSKGAVQMREALHHAKTAFTRAKKAVNSQVSSENAKRARMKRKKTAVKKAAVKTPIAKTAKRSAPTKKPVKKAAAKRRAPAPLAVPVQTPTAHVA